MIQYIYRKDIDVSKYDRCIAKSLQSRVYAYSWYLDVVAENWDVLVLNDYEAVMPLPWKQRYLIKYITQPYFTQQLGVFSIETITENQIEDFLNQIPKKYLKIILQFNSHNELSRNISKKNNYILDLDTSYKEIYKGFSKGRKHAIQQGIKKQLEITNISFKELLIVAKENYSNLGLNDLDYQTLSNLINTLENRGKIILIGVKEENVLIGGSIFILDVDRIIYLFSAISKKGKEKQVASFLLNSIIEKYAELKKTLDFEGSMNKGIATFFKSFGSKNEPYSVFKKRLL